MTPLPRLMDLLRPGDVVYTSNGKGKADVEAAVSAGVNVTADTTARLAEIPNIVAIKEASGDLTQRISTADTESELGQLVAVLNSTFARLDAAFTQQARFTADAAHELPGGAGGAERQGHAVHEHVPPLGHEPFDPHLDPHAVEPLAREGVVLHPAHLDASQVDVGTDLQTVERLLLEGRQGGPGVRVAGIELAVIDADTKARMKDILTDIQDGTFARNFVAECEAGKPEMARARARDAAHPIEQVGKGLRAMFSWLKAA